MPAPRSRRWPLAAIAAVAVAGAAMGVTARHDPAAYDAPTLAETLWNWYDLGARLLHPPGDAWARAVIGRGVLRVAVRTRAMAVPPGMPHADVPEAYDVALAGYLARRLGVPLQVAGMTPAEQGRALAAGQVDLALSGAGADDGQAAGPGYFAGRGRLLVLPLAGQPPAQRARLAGHTLCVDGTGPYRAAVERAVGGDHVRAFPSALVAISAFTGNQCDALVEDEALLERLMTLPAMRFYELTPVSVAGDAPAPVRLPAGQPGGMQDLRAWLDGWKRSGAARRASQRRAGEILIEVAQLQDGYSCH